MLLEVAAQNQSLSSQMKDFDNCNRGDEIPVSNGPWGLFSCFRDQDELDLGSVDEVTKPLYFIVEEVSSQQVRDFSVEAEIHPHYRNEHQHYSIEPISVQSKFRRKLSTLLNRGPRGRFDSATASITRVESAIATNETKSDRKSVFRARNEQLKRLSLKHIKRSFLCLSKKAKRLLQYSASQSPVMRSGYVGFGGSDGSDTSSEDMWEPGSPRILGVSFPHPAFVGDDASRRAFSPKRSAWGRHDAEKKQEALLPPAQYEYGTTEESVCSDGSFPTDECDDSHGERMGIEYDFNDFEDLPFDEATFEGAAGTWLSLESDSYAKSYFCRSNDDDTFGLESLSWLDRYERHHGNVETLNARSKIEYK